MHSKLSERWKLSFRVDFKSIWFDLIRFDLMMRLAGKSWSCTLRRQLNQIKQTRLQSGGQPDSMSYHCLGGVASGATGLVRAWLAWLFSLYDICMYTWYIGSVSAIGAASTLHNSVLLLSTCIYEVENKKSFNQLPGRVAWELSLD